MTAHQPPRPESHWVGTYIRHKGKPLAEYNTLVWAAWMEFQGPRRIVSKSNVCGLVVSTVFLGLDHRFSKNGPPILYETAVFYKGKIMQQIRTCFEKDARRCHRVVKLSVRNVAKGATVVGNRHIDPRQAPA